MTTQVSLPNGGGGVSGRRTYFNIPPRLGGPNIRGHQARDTHHRVQWENVTFPSGFQCANVILNDRAVGDTFPDEAMVHVDVRFVLLLWTGFHASSCALRLTRCLESRMSCRSLLWRLPYIRLKHGVIGAWSARTQAPASKKATETERR